MTTTTKGDGGVRPASASGPGRRSDGTPSMTTVRLAVDVIVWDSDIDRLSSAGCPDCRGTLTLHQPDEASPDLLLAACGRCQGWLLIDVSEGIMVRWPSRQALREARAASAASPDSAPVRETSGGP
jgi:hypothetical protein